MDSQTVKCDVVHKSLELICSVDWNGHEKIEPPIYKVIVPKRTVCGLKICGCQLQCVKATIGDNQLRLLHTADGYFSKKSVIIGSVEITGH